MISKLSVHKVGNKSEDEYLFLSNHSLQLSEELLQLLSGYFLSSFKSEEYYQCFHDTSLQLHEVYTYASAIFEDPSQLHEQSIHLAKHLYNQSTHPKIKGGEFYVAYFEACELDGETVPAIGLFKSENKDTYLKVFPKNESFEIASEQGININKLDKGCLIYYSEKESGFVVAIVDNTNKSTEAQYWIDGFLKVQQRQDTFFNTQNTLAAYKDFITQKLPESYELSKADQVDMLNRSIKFFKDNDSFQLEDFSQQVLHHQEYIEGFNQYKRQYEQEREITLSNSFDISEAAVKRQSRNFKSIIKLDKNFHIYIHGDRDLIEQGEDTKGRFYKIYFENES